MNYSPTAILRQRLHLTDTLQYTLHLPSLAWSSRGQPPDSPPHGANKQVNLGGIYVRLITTALSLVLAEQEVKRWAVIAGCRNMLLLLNRNINNCCGFDVTESGQALARLRFSLFLRLIMRICFNRRSFVELAFPQEYNCSYVKELH